MNKFFSLIFSICMLFGCFASAEEYPAENYDVYYQGNQNYPIVFTQMGYGYVLDRYTLRMDSDNSNELIVDLHEVNMYSNRMVPNPIHVYAKYSADNLNFTIGLKDTPNSKPIQVTTFDKSYLNKGTPETGLLFPAGRMMWECYSGTPLYKEFPMLKPVGESGAPCSIQVNETTRYARLSYTEAEVQMLKPSGIESYTIVFKPDHFVIKSVYANDPQIEQRLRREEVGTIMYYNENPRVRLVANYMGIGPKLTDEQRKAIGAY